MIRSITVRDARFALKPGAGSDAIHRDPTYSYAVTLLQDDSGRTGTGLSFTLGEGNELVCQACAFLAVSLPGKKFGVPVVPHVGDMGQLHQHLVLFNHVGLGHEALFLEHIPHLRDCFVLPVRVEDGVYRTPEEPGSSCDLLPEHPTR